MRSGGTYVCQLGERGALMHCFFLTLPWKVSDFTSAVTNVEQMKSEMLLLTNYKI